jgi:dienelactone hydrolase
VKNKRMFRYVSLFLVILFLLSGCSKANSNKVNVENVNFTTDDGIKLAGTLYLPENNNGIAVILSHQGTIGADQTTWQPFAELISKKGFIALTYDFRGRGKSEGTLVFTLLFDDLLAAIDYANSRGFSRIVCIGASMGGNATLQVALQKNLEGIALVCCTLPYGLSLEDLKRITIPKLFICTEDDTADGILTFLATTMQVMYDNSPEPKQIKIFPGTEHGTLIFDSDNGNEFRDLLLDFLDEIKKK